MILAESKSNGISIDLVLRKILRITCCLKRKRKGEIRCYCLYQSNDLFISILFCSNVDCLIYIRFICPIAQHLTPKRKKGDGDS